MEGLSWASAVKLYSRDTRLGFPLRYKAGDVAHRARGEGGSGGKENQAKPGLHCLGFFIVTLENKSADVNSARQR